MQGTDTRVTKTIERFLDGLAAEGVTEATDDLPAPGPAWAEAMAAECELAPATGLNREASEAANAAQFDDLRYARSTEPRGAWGERFEYEGDGFDPCIEGDDEGES